MDYVMESLRTDNSTLPGVLSRLQDRIGPQKFNAWFRHGTRLSLEDGHLKVAVPNLFVANWIETHYQSDILHAFGVSAGKAPKIVVTIDTALTGEVGTTQLDTQADLVHRAGDGRARQVQPPVAPSLNPRYRLEDFVVGQSNKLAHSAAIEAASGKWGSFGHLFIHGTCGVGKTHLLQGICHAFAKLAPQGVPLRWRYVTGEQFTNEFITSIRKKAGNDFRNRYRNLDLLAIDDVHFLSSKKATQDEFLHTFNAIEAAGKRIVLASDAHPRMVGEINEQLISRFVAGMVVKIDSPDEALRMEILRRRAAAMKLSAPKDVLQYVGAHIRGSIRELEGALVKLAAVSALKSEPLTLSLVNEALADHFARTDSAITLSEIEACVGAYFGLTVADLHSSRRTRTVSVGRMLAMFLARRHTPMSYPEIGKSMGKNHSSVVLAVQRLEELLATNGMLEWASPAGPKSMPAAKLVELLTEQFA